MLTARSSRNNPSLSSDAVLPNQSNPRESMRVLPEWMQLFLTHLTGCPYWGQKPYLLEPAHYITLYVSSFVLGLGLSSLAVKSGFYFLLPAGWILTIGATSGFYVGLVHQAAHRNLTGNKHVDLWFGRFLEIVILMVDFDLYVLGHRLHHLSKTHQTAEDNTIKALFGLMGLRPGMSVSESWEKLHQLWSPLFLGKFLLIRVKGCFGSCNLAIRTVTFVVWGFIIWLVALTGGWIYFWLAYAVPVLAIYPIAHMLRLVVEHKFPNLDVLKQRGKLYICLSTDAVFLGETVPSSQMLGMSKALAWVGWWFRMLCFHGLVRWLILPSDTVVHDYHHRYPGTDDWCNAIWWRQKEVEAGCSNFPAPYSENWGLISGINSFLESISNLPSDYEV